MGALAGALGKGAKLVGGALGGAMGGGAKPTAPAAPTGGGGVMSQIGQRLQAARQMQQTPQPTAGRSVRRTGTMLRTMRGRR